MPETATVLKLDTTSNTWSTGLPLPVPRAQHGAAVVGTTLLVAGGVCGGTGCPLADGGRMSTLETTATLDVSSATGTWQAGPPLPAPIANPSVAATAQRVYVLGSSHDILSWAPGEASWRLDGTLPSAASSLAGFFGTATELVLVAGANLGGPLNLYNWTP